MIIMDALGTKWRMLELARNILVSEKGAVMVDWSRIYYPRNIRGTSVRDQVVDHGLYGLPKGVLELYALAWTNAPENHTIYKVDLVDDNAEPTLSPENIAWKEVGADDDIAVAWADEWEQYIKNDITDDVELGSVATMTIRAGVSEIDVIDGLLESLSPSFNNYTISNDTRFLFDNIPSIDELLRLSKYVLTYRGVPIATGSTPNVLLTKCTIESNRRESLVERILRSGSRLTGGMEIIFSIKDRLYRVHENGSVVERCDSILVPIQIKNMVNGSIRTYADLHSAELATKIPRDKLLSAFTSEYDHSIDFQYFAVVDPDSISKRSFYATPLGGGGSIPFDSIKSAMDELGCSGADLTSRLDNDSQLAISPGFRITSFSTEIDRGPITPDDLMHAAKPCLYRGRMRVGEIFESWDEMIDNLIELDELNPAIMRESVLLTIRELRRLGMEVEFMILDETYYIGSKTQEHAVTQVKPWN